MLFIQRLIWLSVLSAALSIVGNMHEFKPYNEQVSPGNSPPINKKIGSSGDPVVTSDSADCIIPFTRVGNLMVIKAKADTTEGNFIIDTGAPGLILNMTYFRSYKSASDENHESSGITGNTSLSDPTEVKNFSFGVIKYYKAEADRVNLGHLENKRGIKILGLIGMQFFKRFEMIIDYENNLIHLHLINKKETKTYKHPMLNDTTAFNEFPIDVKDNKLYTYGEMAGKKLTFIIDTGAESNVLDSRLPNKVFENVTITGRIVLSGAGTSQVEALSGEAKNIRMSSLEIQSLPVIVTNLAKMCAAYNDMCLDGMLGFDFLSMHKIGFNFVNRKMYIWK